MPTPRAARRPLLPPLLVGLLPLLAASRPAAGEERAVVRVTAGHGRLVGSARFRVERPVEATLEGVGAGRGGSLYAYGWLWDLDRLRLAWSMTEQEPDEERSDGHALVYRDRVTLEPGRYALHYFGRRGMGGGEFVLHELLGVREDRPDEWQASLALDEADASAIAPLPPGEELPGEVRLAPLFDDALVRRRFRVVAPATATVHAVGEGYEGRELVDRSWLVELRSRRVVWSFEHGASERAGGAGKNRRALARLELAPGEYELAAITDDSHSYGEWNALPPFSPEDWGVTVTLPAAALALEGVPEERTLVRLTGARDDERLTATLRVEAAAQVRVHAVGEWSKGEERFADRAWIEDAASASTVWSMRYDDSRPAGGHPKNRLVDASLTLAPGTYRVRYETDDSHAPGRWNAAPPAEEWSWGVTLSSFEPAPPVRLLGLEGETAVARAGHAPPGLPEPPEAPHARVPRPPRPPRDR